MFKITPLQNIDDADKYLSVCSAKMRDGCFIYLMLDYNTEDIMGIAQFEIYDGCGYIFDIKPRSGLDDFEAMFILGRQTMNFMNSCGAEIIRAGLDSAEHSLLKAIGFNKTEEFFECNTNGMFDGSHCSGHNPVADLT